MGSNFHARWRIDTFECVFIYYAGERRIRISCRPSFVVPRRMRSRSRLPAGALPEVAFVGSSSVSSVVEKRWNKMVRCIRVRFCVVGALGLLLPICGCARVRPQRLLIASSSEAEGLVRAWAHEMEHGDHPVNALVEVGNSEKTIGRLIDRKAEIAVCARTIRPEELQRAKTSGVHPREYKVALDAILVIVHRSNRVRELTLDQLRAIYTGEVESWKGVGGGGETIVALCPSRRSELGEFFAERVLGSRGGKKGGTFGPRVAAPASSQAVAQRVAAEPRAIGYLELRWYDVQRHGLVAVGEEERGPFFRPTMETLLYYQYPLSRPVLLYTNGRPKGKVKEFLDFALSSDGQMAAGREGFVPMVGVKSPGRV